jgi:hypothetical protein
MPVAELGCFWVGMVIVGTMGILMGYYLAWLTVKSVYWDSLYKRFGRP